ncbi:putative integral membrane protein [Rosellinia necatrix]|uniref:Putative integral membrane protein n=1 Tax=Rosellinia necatrix TaxID=77044 RepID=A0A1W2TD53_ROSNE|nr:putative integral membrane protein [Rosellinia necatrix]
MRRPAAGAASTIPPLPDHLGPPRRQCPLRQRPPRQRPLLSRVFHRAGAPCLVTVTLLLLAYCAIPVASAVKIPFENCLNEDYKYTNPKRPPEQVQLQFVPKEVDAIFSPQGGNHNLLVTVWGNVTGRVGNATLPPPGDPEWNNPNSTTAINGKIQNTNEPGRANFNATTLHSTVDVLDYRPYIHDSFFCENLQNGECPLGPVFNDSLINFRELPSFNLSKAFDSSYAFASFTPTIIIRFGDQYATPIGCISATVTPTLGNTAWYLKFLPLVVLIVVGFATVFAAIFSPWGTTDVFHWTSNYGRDPDLLRLVTPGFGDCLNYIQLIVLTGSLSLEYPGFYQPAVSQLSWSVLMFNQQFTSNTTAFQSVVDGVYNTTWSSYGLERTAHLVGQRKAEDVWIGMIIWSLVIVGAVLFLTQAGFLGRRLWRLINHDSEEDLRSKNIPFSLGNVVRIIFGYFLLPIVALSAFQLVAATQVPGYIVALAVVTLVVIIGFAVWFIRLIATTKPRAYLFDDLPTVLLYGPLYNTYSDESSGFAFIPIILTIIRGIAVGAVQLSGTAQIVILAVCEVIQLLTLQAFRPFHPATSMNAYHLFFSAIRFVCVIMMVAFTSSLGLTNGPKGWIGYAILIIHGAVLLFGFFLNALQTIVEVLARLGGAGGDDVRGQTRGGLSKIFGARQLSRRVDRTSGPSRLSQLSSTGMLDAAENASKRGYGRVRSESAGSMGIMMSPRRNSSAMDTYSIDAYSNHIGSSTFAGTTMSTYSVLPSPGQATRPQLKPDPYYRPPRARRGTLEEAGSSSLHRPHDSLGSIDLGNHRLSQIGGDADGDIGISGRATPALMPYAPVLVPRADYSTREVDFYYGVRGPALNSDAPGRKLGTGPADPTSPVATATGWVMRLFGGKTKEKGKGFEVVRSARMPSAMKARGGDFSDDTPPEGIPVALGVLRNGPIESDDDDETPVSKKKEHARSDSAGGKLLNDVSEPESDEEEGMTSKIPKDPPLLPDLDAGERFRIPSRVQSKASRHPSQRTIKSTFGENPGVSEIPEVPRKSSKRNSHLIGLARLPFDRSNSQERPSTEDLSRSISAKSSLDDTDQRPMSMGSVHQHNTIRTEPSGSVDLLASTAEVISDPRKPSFSSSIP